MREIDREHIWSVMAELADIAASETLPRFRLPMAIENKLGTAGFDPVTQADIATETALRKAITARFPEHGIRGEEGEALVGSGPYAWIIDPIDGTRSFMSGMPTWGTLIGLLEDGVPRYGMMSQPFVGERFIGGDGVAELVRGTAVTRLRCRATTTLAQATLFTTTPDMFTAGRERSAFDALAAEVRLTRYGADCYGYCLLAAGHIDLVVEANLGFYDIAPLIPIIVSAGGVVTDWSGRALRDGGRAVAAATPALLDAALEHLARAL